MRCREGFRSVHCRCCGKQERSLRNKRQCGIVWHQRRVHRVDPDKHASRNAPVRTQQQKGEDHEKKEKEKEGKGEGRKRKATKEPIIDDEVKQSSSKVQSSKARKSTREPNPTTKALLIRIKEKAAEGAKEKQRKITGSNQRATN